VKTKISELRCNEFRVTLYALEQGYFLEVMLTEHLGRTFKYDDIGEALNAFHGEVESKDEKSI